MIHSAVGRSQSSEPACRGSVTPALRRFCNDTLTSHPYECLMFWLSRHAYERHGSRLACNSSSTRCTIGRNCRCANSKTTARLVTGIEDSGFQLIQEQYSLFLSGLFASRHAVADMRAVPLILPTNAATCRIPFLNEERILPHFNKNACANSQQRSGALIGNA